jgi:MYXO-CTERM domain-containing protein
MSGYPAPYATVTVNLTSSTTASLTFAAATAGNYQYLFLDSSIVDANVNAASWTAGSFAGSTLNSNFSPFTCANTGCNGGSATVDGFGVFNQTVNSFDGYNYAQSTVSFILTDTSGTWANAASVLTPNSNGYLAAAHMAVCDTSLGACSPSIAAIATGYATTSAVPEPTSFMLAAAGLGGLGFLRRRRRKSA